MPDPPAPLENVESSNSSSPTQEGKQAAKIVDAKTELSAELARRDALAAQHNDFLAHMIGDTPVAWGFLLRMAKPNPESALKDGAIFSRRFITAVATADVGRQLLHDDTTMISLVVYIERGKIPAFQHEFQTQLAITAAAEQCIGLSLIHI